MTIHLKSVLTISEAPPPYTAADDLILVRYELNIVDTPDRDFREAILDTHAYEVVCRTVDREPCAEAARKSIAGLVISLLEQDEDASQ